MMTLKSHSPILLFASIFLICGCANVATLRSSAPALLLKEKAVVSDRTHLGNTVTWSLADGIYRPAFEDDEGIFYIAERPVVRISPAGDSMGADSGIYVAKGIGEKVRWAIWNGHSPIKTKYLDAAFPPFTAQK